MSIKNERVPSEAERDLAKRLKADDGGESVLASRSTTLNPNPFGEDAFVGTDPIYQKRANETEQPLAAKSGVDKKAEEAFKKVAGLADDVDEDSLVDDPGMGGKAQVSVTKGPGVPDVTVGASADVTHASDPTPEPSTPEVPGEPSDSTGGNQSPASPAPATPPAPPSGNN
jgi:hypothetical protein